MRNETPTSRRISKTLMITAAGLIGISLSASSVSALLTAEAKNTTAQQITSGTLKLTYADNGAGFATQISNMAPGDVVNRYIEYTNSGTLASKLLKLKVVDTTASPTLLSTSATKGLKLTVSNCSVAWTPGTGNCAGTTTQVLASTALSSLGTNNDLSSPASLAAGDKLNLQFSLSLPGSPENDELSTNGTLPSPTIQGLTANLVWTLTETQRDAATSNS